MNASALRLYALTMKRQFPGYYASCPPGLPIVAGDYGVVEDAVFSRLGSISEFGIDLDVENTNESVSYELSTGEGLQLEFKPAVEAQVPPLHARLEVTFDKENLVFFSASGCKTSRLRSPLSLSPKLQRVREQGDWRDEYVFVGEVINSGNTTVIVSASSGASIELEAEAKTVPYVDLSNASTKIRAAKQKNLAFKATSAELTPLFKLFKLDKPGFLGQRSDRIVKAITAGGSSANDEVSAQAWQVVDASESQAGWRLRMWHSEGEAV